jgi:hypothetical protein
MQRATSRAWSGAGGAGSDDACFVRFISLPDAAAALEASFFEARAPLRFHSFSAAAARCTPSARRAHAYTPISHPCARCTRLRAF